MKKNHPQNSLKKTRKNTVREARVTYTKPKRASSAGPWAHAEKGSSSSKRIIKILAAIVILLLLFPLSCKLIPLKNQPGGKVTKKTEQAANSLADSKTTLNITKSSKSESDGKPDSDEEAVHAGSEESLATSTNSQESQQVTLEEKNEHNYPQGNANLLTPIQKRSADTIKSLSHDRYGWSFNRPEPKHEDIAAKLPAEILAIIEPFGVIWQLPSTGQPTVYLTMDEGYEYEDNSTRILNVAQEKQVGINFFITGDFIGSHPELVTRMVAEGHLVANHSVNHPDMSLLLAEQGPAAAMEELTLLEDEFKELTGKTMPKLFRPPMGVYSPQFLALLNDEGYYPVFWSFAYVDWEVDNQPVPSAALNQILGELHDGSVILIHAVSKTNVEILGDLIDGIRARGYEIALLPIP